MMMKLRKASQHGTVLITVMLMVAVAALIATDIAYRQQMDVLRTGAFLARDAGVQYLFAAEELGLFALEKDRKEDDREFNKNPPTEIKDDLGEEWNKGVIFPLPDGIGTIEGKLYDLQGRFNINELADPDAAKQKVFADTFISMMSDLLAKNPDAFPQGTTASMLKERVTDWLDVDQNNSGFDGMEDDDYFRKERPYRTANHFISDISELLLIDGFTPQVLELLQDKVSFLPLSAKINLYTADADMLIKLGFSATEVTEFTESQRPKVFKDEFKVEYNNVNDVFTYLIGTNTAAPQIPQPVPGSPQVPQSAATKLQVDWFDIKSEFFLLKGKAVVNGKPVLVESVLWKPPLNNPAAPVAAGAAQQTIPVRTILRKFVDPLKQTN